LRQLPGDVFKIVNNIHTIWSNPLKNINYAKLFPLATAFYIDYAEEDTKFCTNSYLHILKYKGKNPKAFYYSYVVIFKESRNMVK
jgi:hypothetical protein